MIHKIIFFGILVSTILACSSKIDPVDKNLVLYLPLNGSSIDNSFYHNTGIVDSSSFTLDRNSKSNKAGLFDSTDTYLRIPNSTVLDTLTNFTLSAWINPVSFRGVGNNSIINKGVSTWGNPYYQYHLGLTGDKHPSSIYRASFIVSVSVNNQYITLASDPNTWVAGNWYHVAGTYDGKVLKLFVNGELA